MVYFSFSLAVLRPGNGIYGSTETITLTFLPRCSDAADYWRRVGQFHYCAKEDRDGFQHRRPRDGFFISGASICVGSAARRAPGAFAAADERFRTPRMRFTQ